MPIRSFFTPYRLLVFFVFGGFFLAGLLSFRDYGLSADEPMGLWFGYHTYGYLFLGKPVPTLPDWTFYGPAWQLFLAAANELAGGTGGEAMWLLRHFLNFTLFFGGDSGIEGQPQSGFLGL